MSTTAQKTAINNFRLRHVQNGGSILNGVILSKEATEKLNLLKESRFGKSRTAIIEKLIMLTV